MIDYENIPKELTELKQWVCALNDSKAPMRAYENDTASSVNPETWASFKTAVEGTKGYYDHIGFVFDDNGYVGIDIDDGFDEDGFISALASDIISRCGSYTERSKSGRGFHILVKGDIPFKGMNNLKGVEIYKDSRYFIMTGDVVIYDTIIENQEALDYIVETYFPKFKLAERTNSAQRIYQPIWKEVKVDGKVKLRPHYPQITSGSRNVSLTSIAGQLRAMGYSKEDMLKELSYVNKIACDPPLKESEIRNICVSIMRYQKISATND